MSEASPSVLYGTLVEETLELSLSELCHVCHAHREVVVTLVDEGVLQPRGERPQDWRFEGASLRRARTALRLARDLELEPAGVALALDLLDEIDALKSRLRRMGA